MRPYLRRNKEKGSFSDIEQYLDVQFRLLREDFVSPMRDGIAVWKAHINDGESSFQVLSDRNFLVFNNPFLYQYLVHIFYCYMYWCHKVDKNWKERLFVNSSGISIERERGERG